MNVNTSTTLLQEQFQEWQGAPPGLHELGFPLCWVSPGGAFSSMT